MRWQTAFRAVVLVLAVAVTVAGPQLFAGEPAAAAPVEAPGVWAAPESYKVDKFGQKIFVLDRAQKIAELKRKNALWDAATRSLTLNAARGETAVVQLFIEGGADGLKEVDVKLGALSGPNNAQIPADKIARFKVWYVEMRGKGSGPTYSPSMGEGWYPDALVPWEVADCAEYTGYDGPPFAVKGGELQEVWIDITVPYGVPAGDYKSSVEIAGVAAADAKLPLTLHVYDFDLPRKIHNTLFMNFGMADINQPGANWLKGDKIRIHEEAIYRDARAHRFTAGNMYNPDTPKVTEENGELKKTDWAAYDAHYDKVLSPYHNLYGPGEDPIEIWKVPLYTGIRSGNAQFPKGDKAWDQMIVEIKNHWKENGWDLNRAYVYLADEPSRDVADKLNAYAQRVKDSPGPNLRRQIAVYTILGKAWDSQQPVFDLWGKALDQWMVAGDYYNVDQMKKLPADALRGMYQGGEPFQGNPTLDSDGVAFRSWSWIAWMYRLDFQCYYSMSEAWAGKGRRGDERNNCEIWVNPVKRFGMSEGVFTYPGKRVNYDLPIWNIRTKEIRRGQTDFEYFWLLKQAGENDLADKLVKGVIKQALNEGADAPEQYGYGKWSHNPVEWDDAIRQAAAKLEELKAKLPKEPATLKPVEPPAPAAATGAATGASAPAAAAAK